MMGAPCVSHRALKERVGVESFIFMVACMGLLSCFAHAIALATMGVASEVPSKLSISPLIVVVTIH